MSVSNQYQIERERRRRERATRQTKLNLSMVQRVLDSLSEHDKQLWLETINEIEASMVSIAALTSTNPYRAESQSTDLMAQSNAVSKMISRFKQTYVANFEAQFETALRQQSTQQSDTHAGDWAREAWHAVEDTVLQDFLKPHIGRIVQQIAAEPAQKEAIWAQALQAAATEQEAWEERQAEVHRQQTLTAVTEQLGDEEVASIQSKTSEELLTWSTEQIHQQVDREFQLQLKSQLESTLTQSGFHLASVQDTGSQVRIVARKPSGSRAMFIVDDAGGLLHKFDNYEGHACKEDAEGVIDQLRSVYGVQFDEERLLWEAPIRISKDARPLPNNQRRDR